MKSKYFQAAGFSDDGIEKLKTVNSMNTKSIGIILDWFEKCEKYPKFYENTIIEISKKANISGHDCQQAVFLIKHIIDETIENDDNLEYFYEDIKKLQIIDDKKSYIGLDLLFSRLPKILEKFVFFIRKRSAQHDGSPNLTYSSMTANIRPVYRKRFEYGEDNIKEYDPSPIGYCAVADIELKKSDNDEHFVFHADNDTLNMLVSDLLALQQELKRMTELSKKLK